MSNAFIEAFKHRRSQYVLGLDVSLSRDELSNLIMDAVKYSPAAFNSQSSRALILFGAESEKLWSITVDEVSKIVPAKGFDQVEGKLMSFSAGVGTVLFYEDQSVVTSLQKEFAPYADSFPRWSEHSCGMAQLAVWSALACVNVGASLQHYNPIIDAAVARQWGIPDSWALRAQMPFGSNAASIPDKTFMGNATRFKVVGDLPARG